MFTTASYAVAGTLIGYGAVLGRVGPKDLMLMAMVKITGYTLSEQIIYKMVGAIDVGGSMTIHTFGATYGLVVSLFLSSAVKPESKPKVTYNANIFALIGTLFLWMYWPSFNFGYFANTDFNKTQIISNTILSLTGSCLSSFMTSSFISSKFTMEHILNATLAGGVIIGAASSLLYHPGGALAIGFGAGIISTLGFMYLSPYL
jgi:ammonium transporter Rh